MSRRIGEQKGKSPDLEQRPLTSGDDEVGESIHAAVIRGLNGTGEMYYTIRTYQ